MDHFLKVFIEFITVLFPFYVLVFWLWGMQDLTCPIRDWTRTACIGSIGVLTTGQPGESRFSPTFDHSHRWGREVVSHLPSAFPQWLKVLRASLAAQLVKNLPAMQETPVQFLGREDPLEKGEAAHCSVLGLPWWLSWQRKMLSIFSCAYWLL